MVLLDKVPIQKTRNRYATSVVEYGWTRNVLLNMILNKTGPKKSSSEAPWATTRGLQALAASTVTRFCLAILAPPARITFRRRGAWLKR